MTDTEIIKALECCTTKGAKCSDCPAFKKVDRSDCKNYFRGAIDLINSQKAEIERLKKLLEEADVNYNTCAKRFYKEAIKDFAEKMKGVIPEIDDTYIERFVEDYIDNLVKEMVGNI